MKKQYVLNVLATFLLLFVSFIANAQLLLPADSVVIPAVTSSNSADSLAFTKNLKRGMQDPDVKRLKEFLFPGVVATEVFDPALEQAVGKFQLKYGVVSSDTSDGYGQFGPKTRAKMLEVLRDTRAVAAARRDSIAANTTGSLDTIIEKTIEKTKIMGPPRDALDKAAVKTATSPKKTMAMAMFVGLWFLRIIGLILLVLGIVKVYKNWDDIRDWVISLEEDDWKRLAMIVGLTAFLITLNAAVTMYLEGELFTFGKWFWLRNIGALGVASLCAGWFEGLANTWKYVVVGIFVLAVCSLPLGPTLKEALAEEPVEIPVTPPIVTTITPTLSTFNTLPLLTPENGVIEMTNEGGLVIIPGNVRIIISMESVTVDLSPKPSEPILYRKCRKNSRGEFYCDEAIKWEPKDGNIGSCNFVFLSSPSGREIRCPFYPE